MRILNMKRLLFAVAAATTTFSVPALAADVGVSITVGEPGFYGRIELGDFPRPQLIYRKPVLVRRIPRGAVLEPIYLHVPPGHERHWSKHCRQYDACGQPVYFVRDNWYNDVYVSKFRERNRDHDREHHDNQGGRHDDGRDRDHDKGKKDQ
jgi:hypothetical protein